MTTRGKVLWTPPAERQAGSAIRAFMGQTFSDYAMLQKWSVSKPAEFWNAVWNFCEVIHSGEVRSVLSNSRMPGALWFEGAELNFAENLLRHNGARTAIVFESENESLRRTLSFDDLRDQVARCAEGLRRAGVQPGDRVCAFTPNVPEAVVAYLATASIGAIWSSCSPDFGPQGVIDRFGQIGPRVLFAADETRYSGNRHELDGRIEEIQSRIPTIDTVVVYPFARERPTLRPGQVAWADFLGEKSEPLRFERFPFAHPLAILYTSGTTGVPKCIVHSAGGTLLKHLEEHRLQVDLRPEDKFFYFSTCGWMMWNWLVSGLATGCTIVLYDGNPLHPDASRLFRMVDQDGISIFGTSPRFLSAVENAGLVPRDIFSLGSLRTMLSTGSPLHPRQFEWVYRAIKDDVMLSSISGGTDLIGCFVLGSPLHPVRSGEISCKALGMDVESLDEEGRPLVNEKGELACATPFPSMPIKFWNDPDGAKYKAAYFERFPGKWHHGDLIELFEDGASVIHGRSDATLNPGGVRIGTAEIYRALQGVPGVVEGIAVGRRAGADERIVLFVVLDKGLQLDSECERAIRSRIRAEVSPRHVPAEIHQIAEVPRTMSGKSVELAVARILRGEEVKNLSTLANPEALEQFRKFAR